MLLHGGAQSLTAWLPGPLSILHVCPQPILPSPPGIPKEPRSLTLPPASFCASFSFPLPTDIPLSHFTHPSNAPLCPVSPGSPPYPAVTALGAAPPPNSCLRASAVSLLVRLPVHGRGQGVRKEGGRGIGEYVGMGGVLRGDGGSEGDIRTEMVWGCRMGGIREGWGCRNIEEGGGSTDRQCGMGRGRRQGRRS